MKRYNESSRRLRSLRLLTCVCIALQTCVSVSRSEQGLSLRGRETNLAAGKTVQFLTPPNYPDTTDPDDAKQLVDGELADAEKPIWYDRRCVGWSGPRPIQFVLDLGVVAPIRGVALRVGAGQAGADWPREIRLFVSDTGEKFSPLGELMKQNASQIPPGQYAVLWLEAGNLKTHGRYLKFQVQPTDTGHGCYFFLDEMEVYEGDRAFLKLPLPEPEPTVNPDSPRPQWENLAFEKPVQFDTPPNDPDTTDEADARQMVDGALSPAIPLWRDKSAIGWVGIEAAMFTVDLGSAQPIRGVAVHIGAGQAGVEWPASVQVHVSKDGGQFSLLGDLMKLQPKPPPEKGYTSLWLLADHFEAQARYVRFTVGPGNPGSGAYIFLDEVEIYRGAR